jgi:hypothetical protein
MSLPFHSAANLIGITGIAHGFFGREGGVSDGLYASLNCGPGSKDDHAKVRENRARVVSALAPGTTLITLAQIHSPIVHIVDSAWDGASHPEGDGMVTATPGMALGIQTADCTPVLFADVRRGIIGAAHAGWKGALYGVLDATVAAMEKLGAQRKDIAAAIGPTIARQDYEVGAEFRETFLARSPDDAKYFSSEAGRLHFDLPAYAAHRLAETGIADVAQIGLSTYPPENGFFSFRRTTHRREPDYGRQISAIALQK